MSKKYNEDFENVLQDPALGLDIGPDETAMESSGLIHPDDLELERILAEDWDSVPDQEIPEMTPEEALNQFLYGDQDEAVSLSEDPTQVLPVPAEEVPAEEYSPAAPQSNIIHVDLEQDDGAEEPVYLPAESEAEADVPDQENAEEEAPLPKGRPKWRKGYGLLGIPHIISTAIWLAITLAIGVSLGRVLWVCCADVMAFGKPQVTGYITVTEEDDIESIARKLADANLIRYPGLFQKFAELTGKGERIDAGTYTLGSHLDYNALLNNMRDYGPAMDVVELMFPEGYNCAQIFAKLEEEGVCTAKELEDYAANGELSDYWFLEGVERGSKYCLEGHLAPDTYKFYTNDDPGRVLEKFLDAFDANFTDKMQEDFELMQMRYENALRDNGYGSDYIDAHPLTLHKVITVASIVQKETANDAESYDIASVFYNRLTNPGNHPYLGSDATVYYAIGDYFGEVEELTNEHLNVDSPYNTRNHQGLPPGPICNPGSYTMYAALDPNRTDYYYFVYSAVEREHLFSSTLAEHEQKLRELGM